MRTAQLTNHHRAVTRLQTARESAAKREGPGADRRAASPPQAKGSMAVSSVRAIWMAVTFMVPLLAACGTPTTGTAAAGSASGNVQASSNASGSPPQVSTNGTAASHGNASAGDAQVTVNGTSSGSAAASSTGQVPQVSNHSVSPSQAKQVQQTLQELQNIIGQLQ